VIPTISAMMWIGPRVTVAMGEDAAPLRVFARRSRNGVPTAAILLQGGVASLLLLTQSFEAVLEFVQFGLIACSFLTVLGLTKLRITQPELPRPCRTWSYPLTPRVFLAVALFMMAYLVAVRPFQSLAGLLMMLVGLVLYAVAKVQTRRRVHAEPLRHRPAADRRPRHRGGPGLHGNLRRRIGSRPGATIMSCASGVRRLSAG